MRTSLLVAALFGSIVTVSAQSGAWQQCGGIGWTGATTCVSGYVCNKQNDYYSQCIPGGATTTPPSTTTTKTTTPGTTTTTSTAPAGTGSQIRAVQDPVFHLYLQNDAGTAVLGPEGSSGYFTISGSIALNSSTGSKLYLNIGSETTSYKSLTFGTTATTTGWGLEGDTIITTSSSSWGRQLNFLACTTSKSGEYKVYLQTGSATPSGTTCSTITLHLPCLC